MGRTLFLCVFLLMGAGLCQASPRLGVVLEDEHGKDLNKAPFAMRYSFAQQTGMDWADSTYDQRKDFLTNWYLNLQERKRKETYDERQEDIEQRNKDTEKKVELQEIRYDARQTALEQRQEEMERRQAKRQFDQEVKERERDLRNMRMNQRKDKSN